MTFLDDAKYCAAIVRAAEKYNKYGINVAEEYDFISSMEEEITYNVTKSETDELVLTNRVFFFRHIVIKLCRDELGTDANIELFKLITALYKNLGEVVIRCHNRSDSRFDFVDSLAFKKNQVEFVMNNSKGTRRIIYSLMYAEIDYIISKYCKQEFVEGKDLYQN